MKNNITGILVAIALIGGAFLLIKSPKPQDGSQGQDGPAQNSAPSSNVTVENGVQVVEISARGGYSPRKSIAKAGLPTVIRFVTNGSFDCSSAVSIPEYKIRRSLPASGVTDIELPASPTGTLKGTCAMGMYRFEVYFQS